MTKQSTQASPVKVDEDSKSKSLEPFREDPQGTEFRTDQASRSRTRMTR